MGQVSIITVYNKEKIYQSMLQTVASNKKVEINIIGIDNSRNAYSSAASAYNHALSECGESDVYILCHQDVLFSKDTVDIVYQYCIANPDTLVGVAGVENIGKKRQIISRMKDPWAVYTSLPAGGQRTFFHLMSASSRAIKGYLKECSLMKNYVMAGIYMR